MPTSSHVLRSLNVDLAKEHGAIVQYLLHAAQMRDSELRWTITEAAREEMWHMEWLIEAIRDRGGTPTLNRQEGIVYTDGLVRNVEADIDAENDALAHYEQTLGTIGDSDEALTTLINRIMDDERHHRTSFTNSAARIGTKGESVYRAVPGISPTDAATTAPMIVLEYEGLLQYLWNKYGVEEEGELSETYFELAINEMRHFNWVTSCYGGLPASPPPPVPKERVVGVDGPEAAHERADAYERAAAEVIRDTHGAVAGPRIAEELDRIDYQHGYHRWQLERME